MASSGNSRRRRGPLRISRKYDCGQWAAISTQLDRDGKLGVNNEPGWLTAIEIVRDRFESRFLEYVRAMLPSEFAGFAVLVLDSLVIEALARARGGQRKQPGQSTRLVTEFLRERRAFRRHFLDKSHDKDHPGKCQCVACDFYRNVRSGLIHEGETQSGWLVRYGESRFLRSRRDGTRVLDRNRFHAAVESEFKTYLRELRRDNADGAELRKNLKELLDGVCSV
jgi:hypothetical protein